MKGTVHNEAERAMINYLLGSMAEAEQIRFEDSYFSDDAQFEQLQAVKQELVDAYVRGHLEPAERELFERNFLSTAEGRQQVVFAQSLRNTLKEREAAEAAGRQAQAKLPFADWAVWLRPIKWGFATAILGICAVGLGWLYRDNQRLAAELARVQNEQAASARRELALQQELAQLRVPPTPTPAATQPTPNPARLSQPSIPTLPAVSLLAATRFNNISEIPLPPNAHRLPLQLMINFDPGNTTCEVVLRDKQRLLVARQSGLRARSFKGRLAIPWTIVTSKLKPGEYEITLSGTNLNQQARQLSYSLRFVR